MQGQASWGSPGACFQISFEIVSLENAFPSTIIDRILCSLQTCISEYIVVQICWHCMQIVMMSGCSWKYFREDKVHSRFCNGD